MRRKEHHLALEIFHRVENGTLDRWERRNLRRVELFPWQPRILLPKGQAADSYANIVEVLGLSTAGKTSLVHHLRQELAQPDLRTTILDEFEMRHPLTGITRDERALLELKEIAHVFGLERQHTTLELFKMVTFFEAVGVNINFLREDAQQRRQGEPILTIVTRGPNDILATQDWVLRQARGKQELPLSWTDHIIEDGLRYDPQRYAYPGYTKDLTRNFFQALAMAEMVSAVIFMGVSFETTKKMRISMGKPPEGKVVNARTPPHMEHGYGWWLGSIYPLQRKRHGTGLLVLDGERSQEENFQTALNYCRAITGLK